MAIPEQQYDMRNIPSPKTVHAEVSLLRGCLIDLPEALSLWSTAVSYAKFEQYFHALEQHVHLLRRGANVIPSAPLWFNLGSLWASVGDLRRAVDAYEISTMEDDTLTIAWFCRGVATFLLHEYGDSRNAFDRCFLTFKRMEERRTHDEYELEYEIERTMVVLNIRIAQCHYDAQSSNRPCKAPALAKHSLNLFLSPPRRLYIWSPPSKLAKMQKRGLENLRATYQRVKDAVTRKNQSKEAPDEEFYKGVGPDKSVSKANRTGGLTRSASAPLGLAAAKEVSISSGYSSASSSNRRKTPSPVSRAKTFIRSTLSNQRKTSQPASAPIRNEGIGPSSKAPRAQNRRDEAFVPCHRGSQPQYKLRRQHHPLPEYVFPPQPRTSSAKATSNNQPIPHQRQVPQSSRPRYIPGNHGVYGSISSSENDSVKEGEGKMTPMWPPRLDPQPNNAANVKPLPLPSQSGTSWYVSATQGERSEPRNLKSIRKPEPPAYYDIENEPDYNLSPSEVDDFLAHQRSLNRNGEHAQRMRLGGGPSRRRRQ